MPILQADGIPDLILSTLNDLGRFKWTDIASSLQNHVAMPNLLQKHKVGFQGGKGIQWNIMVKNSGNARQTGLYSTDNVNVKDVMKQAEAPWRHTEAFYAYDVREMLMNAGESAIFELIKTRRSDSLVSLAEHLEDQFWRIPTSSADENVWGVNYWIVYNHSATAGSFAFTNALPSGITSIAGLSPTTYTRWRNGAAKYSSIDATNSATNLITLWREAAVKCNFKSLPMAAMPQYATGMQMGYYTNYTVIQKLEHVLTQQNDNLGNDIASKDGAVVFKRIPVEYVPYLDTCNQNPVYGLDWSAFQPVFLEGNYMRETHKMNVDGQHNVSHHFVDLTMNLRCTDRRKQFVLSDGGSAISFNFAPTTGD